MPEWIGKTIGKVRIDKYLARGGMAEVYLGSHLTLDRLVAVKVMHSYIEEDPSLLARFQREARVVAGLRHPNIVQIYDFDTADGHPYIVMEYLKGPSLANYLRTLDARSERIPPHQVARLLKGLTSALDYAHEQGVIHRDIKPGNILLHGKADEISVERPLTNDVEPILTDFGLVRITHSATQTASGLVSGTPAYMSPEQARGDKTDHRTDIYSLGVVLYEMLAGRVPFEGDSTLAVMYQHINQPPPPIEDALPAVQSVIDKTLAKNPDDRYQTSAEMAVDFFHAVGMNAEAETIYEPPPSTTSAASVVKAPETVAKPKPARSTTWIGIGVAASVCLIALAFGASKLLSSILARATSDTATASPAAASTPATPSPLAPTGLPSSEGMVKISAGSYEVGMSPSGEFYAEPQSVALQDFWIDIYQVTNAQYQKYLDQSGAQPPAVWPVTGKDNHPVIGVNWDQANAYCASLNKRLPSEAEWEAAGRGSGTAPPLYPWGSDPTDEGKALALPNDDTYDVGKFPFNVSPFGVHDLVGNVWEWVGEPYASVKNGYHIVRGGRFGNPVELSYRLPVAPDNNGLIQYAGFRCAASEVQ